MSKISAVIKHNRMQIVAFVLGIMIVMLAELLFRNSNWMYDCADYWSRGNLLRQNNFKLSSIDGFRGYIYPLYLGIVGKREIWVIVNACLLSAFFTVVLPLIQWNERVKTWKQLISLCSVLSLTECLFVGAFGYPMSDLFALVCLSLSLLFLKKAIETDKWYYWIFLMLFVGIFAYAAYNIRTVYMFAGLSMIPIYFVLSVKSNRQHISKLGDAVIGFICACLGGFAAGVPQLIMNKMNMLQATIKVPTNGLMLQQMYWGIQYQRYDTYVPEIQDLIHTNPQIYFADETGMQILQNMGMNSFGNWGDYFRLVIKHPFDVLGIYVRHAVNFIFPCWPEMYVKNLDSVKWPMGIIGVSILFFAVAMLLLNVYCDYKVWIYYIPMLIPALLIIPGAVEFRFSLPIYLFAISQVCMNINYEKAKMQIIKYKWSSITAYIIILMLCMAIWSNMLASETVRCLFL